MNNLRNLQGLSNIVAVSCHREGRDRASGIVFFKGYFRSACAVIVIQSY